MTVSDRIRVKDIRLLSDNHYILKTATFEWRRANGAWQTQHRESYDRGNGATLLPYNLAQRSVVLVRQFRYPAYVNGYDDLLIEAAAGLLDNYSPDMRVGSGGGIADEGEDIEVLELPIDSALAMIGDGRIVDAKTIMLLQYAALHIFR